MSENKNAAGANGGAGEGSANNPLATSHSNIYGLHLLPHHADLLRASTVSPDVVAARGYRSIGRKADLERKGFSPAQRNVPGLLVPVYGVTGELATYQYRPDEPRVGAGGHILKYETPTGSRLALDVPRLIRDRLADPRVPLWITEGARKADAAVSRDLCSIALLGVWGWRGSNEHGGKAALADWESVALNGRVVYLTFDSDVSEKREVHDALTRLKAFLEVRGATVRIVYLPACEDGAKVGLDDFLAAGHSVDDLLALASVELRPPAPDLDADRESQRRAASAFALARPLLQAPDLLERIADAITAGGYAGERTAPMLGYVALTSRLTDRPINLAYTAPSAAGKNRAVDGALALMPATAYHLVQASSPRALVYGDDDFQHRTVILAEADSLPEDGPAASAVRSIMTDNAMTYDVVEREEETGRHYTRRIVKPGPTGLITTSTRPLGAQADTRVLTVSVSDTADQTRAVLAMHAAHVNGQQPSFDKAPFVALQEWLALAGEHRVTIPFAHRLAELVPTEHVRMRRDFRQLLTAIQTVALLHQCQRPRDAEGRIVATAEDYRLASGLLMDAFTTAATGGVSAKVRETVGAVKKLTAEKGQAVTVKAVGDALGLAKDTALHRCRRAISLGFVVNTEDRKGRPAQLVPGDPLPDERPTLPAPEEITITGPDTAEPHSTVQPSAAAGSYVESGGAVEKAVESGDSTAARPAPDTESPDPTSPVERLNPDPDVPPTGAGEDAQERCACGAALSAYTAVGRAVCVRHAAPGVPCWVCGCAVWWARRDGGWVCSRCHPAPSPEAVLDEVHL